MTLRIVGVTDVGLIREHNEDNFLVVALDSGETDFGQGREIPVGARGALLVVCDGMGGAAAGEVASKMAVDVILREMSPDIKVETGANPKPAVASARQPDSRSDSSEADTVPPIHLDEKPAEPAPGLEKSAPLDEKPVGAAEAMPSVEKAPSEPAAKLNGPEPAAPIAPLESASTAEVPVPRLSPRTIDDLLSGLDDHLAPPTATSAPASEKPAADPAPKSEPDAVSDAVFATQPEAKIDAPAEAKIDVPSPGPATTPKDGSAEAHSTPKSDEAAAKDGQAAADPDGPTTPSAPPASAGDLALREAAMHILARKLRIAATKANQEIYDAACADIAKAGMGTTLTGLLLVRTHVIVAQVGDSRAYMWRKGKLTQITHDQSLVNQLLDSGQITAEQAKLFEHSNVILQALGVQEDVEVVLSTEEVRRDDRLLLCSDGLVGVVADEEIQEVLGSTDKIEEAARRLVDLARAGGGPDNITVIVAQVTGDDVPPPATTEDVAYRPLYLDGEKPPERRVWAPEYGFIGQPMIGHNMAAGGAQPAPVSSRTSVMAMSAVLALLVAGIVAGVIWYKQPPESRPGPQVAVPQALPPPPPANHPLPPTTPPEPTAVKPATDGTLVPPTGPANGTPTPPAPTLQVPPVAPTNEPAPGTPPEEGQPGTAPGTAPTPAPLDEPTKHHHRKRTNAQPGTQPVTPPEPGVTPPPIAPPETPPAPPVEKPPVPVEKPPVTSEKPPVTPERPPVTPERPPVTPERPPVTSERPPVTSEKPPVTPDKPVEKPAAPTPAPAPAAEKPAASGEAPKP